MKQTPSRAPRSTRSVAFRVGLSAAAAFVSLATTAEAAVTASARLPRAVAVGDSLASYRRTSPTVEVTGRRDVIDSLRGRSGKLRARFVAPSHDLVVPVVQRVFGESAVQPGTYVLKDTSQHRSFSFIPLLPFTSKSGGRVENYRMGFWPAEKRGARSAAYENPAGFIRVTAENRDTEISEHFRLGDFLTHDQPDVWPKYLVLREDLVDKLELVIDDLRAHGVRVEHMAVMSGFRTPQYNQRGVGRGGRAKDSRHQFGDAADVFVDNDGDGRMDDLNHDGRVDTRDAQLILDAIDRVERAHPDLVGGAGRYRGTRVHGPFVHVDVRGSRARWRNG